MKMFSLTPLLRLGCSSINIKYIIRLMKKNNIHTPCRHLYFQQINTFNIYKLQKYSTGQNEKDLKLSENVNSAPQEVTTFEAIKENTKTALYGTLVIAGFGLAAAIFYAIFRELFSSNSPNNVYSQALERCRKDEKVIFNLGEPVKGHGEENRRRRRQHVSHIIYEKDNVNYMRMKFYLNGSRKNGTVHLEMKENENGKYEYRYLFVQVDGYPHNTIILEDNRNKTTLSPLTPLNESTMLI